MAVMLTQWSPVPWSGETVSRPALPSPAEAAAPTPIYETLVREWSRAGRTVPGQARGGHDEFEDGGGLRWWRTDDAAHRSYGPPPPVVPTPAPAPVVPAPTPAPARAGEAGDPGPEPTGDASGEAAPEPPVWERVAVL